MATRRSSGTRPEVVRCPNCGEDYSVTYKRCPFCDEKVSESAHYTYDEDETEGTRRGGGKRLATNSRGGGYGGGGWGPLRIIGTVISLGIIVAAVWIVISILSPMVNRGDGLNSPDPSNSPIVQPSQSPTPSPSGGVDATPQPSGTPEGPDVIIPSAEPTDQVPSTQTATSFTLNKSEFSLTDRYPDPITLKVTFLPAGSTGSVTWSSSNTDIIQVDQSGKVSPGAKQGNATVTATMAGGYTQSCKVYNSVTGGGQSSSGSQTAASSGSLTISHSDVTLYKAGETFRLRLSGTDTTPTWSSSDTGVASVSGDGTVTAVGKGTCNITTTVNGETYKCIVRCNIS